MSAIRPHLPAGLGFRQGQLRFSPLGPRGMSVLNSSSYGVKNILSLTFYVACSPFLKCPRVEGLVCLFVFGRTHLVSVLIKDKCLFLNTECFDGIYQFYMFF